MWRKALELLAIMRRDNIEPNEIVYGGVIKACCAGGQAGKVILNAISHPALGRGGIYALSGV